MQEKKKNEYFLSTAGDHPFSSDVKRSD